VPDIGFDVVIIDEYQDTSEIENSIIAKLAKDKLVVVGDVMQSIYGFRGATIQNMVNIQVDKRYSMSKSFRVPDNIVALANKLIAKNDFNYDLVMNAANPGGALRIVNDTGDEALMAELDMLLTAYPPEDIFILTRTNRQVGRLLYILDSYPIDKEMAAVKNMKYLTYLDIACTAFFNGYYNHSLIRLLRLFDYRDADLIKLEMLGGNIYERVKNDAALRRFDEVMQRKTPFRKQAETLLPLFEKQRGEYDMFMTRVLPYLDGIESAPEFMEWYRDASAADFMPKDKIAVITVHMAKGMENNAILIPGVEDGVFPNHRASFQEELRLFYVAVTRAKKHLSIMHDKSVFLEG
ncbi:MAG: ATP-dependent helicase, partial [Candidatus Subteraquimicrobiales bacterium]|nr:ATP-dependent helicase [Candidatus Subteraquimicrobiales bacterium]